MALGQSHSSKYSLHLNEFMFSTKKKGGGGKSDLRSRLDLEELYFQLKQRSYDRAVRPTKMTWFFPVEEHS
jgi:hypothetical protein